MPTNISLEQLVRVNLSVMYVIWLHKDLMFFFFINFVYGMLTYDGLHVSNNDIFFFIFWTEFASPMRFTLYIGQWKIIFLLVCSSRCIRSPIIWMCTNLVLLHTQKTLLPSVFGPLSIDRSYCSQQNAVAVELNRNIISLSHTCFHFVRMCGYQYLQMLNFCHHGVFWISMSFSHQPPERTYSTEKLYYSVSWTPRSKPTYAPTLDGFGAGGVRCKDRVCQVANITFVVLLYWITELGRSFWINEGPTSDITVIAY